MKVVQELATIDPPVTFDFFFSRHSHARDAEGLRERILDCDVYIPECIGWNEQLRRHMQRLSAGDPNLQVRGDARALSLADAIRGTQKPIAFIDYPEGSSLKETAADVDFDETVSFEDALAAVSRYMQFEDAAQQEREIHMLEQLPSRLREVVEGLPELKAKDELKVLLSLGTGHSPLFHVAREVNKGSTRTFPRDQRQPYLFLLEMEVRRCFRHGVVPARDLLARAFWERHFEELVVQDEEAGIAEITTNLRRFVEQFSFADCEALYNQWRATQTDEETNAVLARAFEIKQRDGTAPI